MIISPPFLPEDGPVSSDPTATDPMMDTVDQYEDLHGIYPIASDRRWHPGMHLGPRYLNEPVRAIADGEVVCYRVCQHRFDGGGCPDGDTNAGFVLLRHTTETGDGRTLTFYSLYMHLLELAGYQAIGGNASLLPEFLRMPSDGPLKPRLPLAAQPGHGRKVCRKDVLGWLGACHGVMHLHFEIFMTPPDFAAYFGATQLGREQPVTPSTTDWWGHSHYVIPPRRQFLAQPVGTDAHNLLNGIEFAPLQNGVNDDTLYVESWFHKGTKYTSVWRDAGGGRRELLTPDPIQEKDYEYDLYARATALYRRCPSDGYELLRFGRILSAPATLPEQEQTTWIRVAFKAGQQGYIDLNRATDSEGHPATILKLSDADFPFFKGWQKITEGTGPFDAEGLWDRTKLQKLLHDMESAKYDMTEENCLAAGLEWSIDTALLRYVRTTESVRPQLRGFVCETHSEWDTSNNENRYHKLKEKGGFFEGREAGYKDFIDRLTAFQFWDQTGLPAGGKLWFFHPLQFIRHFRRCGWLSLSEQTQLLPRKSMPTAGGLIRWNESKKRFINGTIAEGGTAPQGLSVALNHIFRKYGFYDHLRKAHFLGQIFKETSALQFTCEYGDATYFTKMYERYTAADAAHDFDQRRTWLANLGFLKNRDRATYIAKRPDEIHEKAVAGGNTQPGDGPRFRGRGLIHLTWRNGYRDYGHYRARDFTTDPNPTLLQSDAEVAADSAGYFWVKTGINRKADLGSGNQDVQACFRLVGGSGGLPERQQFFRYAYFILGDTPSMPMDRDLARQTEVGDAIA